jgi:hypothetical protein
MSLPLKWNAGPRRTGRACAMAGIVLWLASEVLCNGTYYGDHVTFRFDRGYAAVWIGGDAVDRNTSVLSNFEYPFYPGRGAGIGWTPERGHELYGPASMLTGHSLRRAAQYPRRGLGLWWPAVHVWPLWLEVGLPFWCVGAVGSCLLVAGRFAHPRASVRTCWMCGYDLSGLTGPCPECGKGRRDTEGERVP